MQWIKEITKHGMLATFRALGKCATDANSQRGGVRKMNSETNMAKCYVGNVTKRKTHYIMTIEEIAEQVRTQDNRITDNPVFIVQQKRRIYGIDTDIDDVKTVWMQSGEEAHEKDAAEMDKKYEDGEDTSDFDRVGYIDIWEFVTACFTEKGCQDFIDRMAHRLHEPRIYVESGYRNEEWKTMREFLKNQKPASGPDICGLCGLPGADKIPHTIYWPGERLPDTKLVHEKCEDEECRRAYELLTMKQVDAFLKTIH